VAVKTVSRLTSIDLVNLHRTTSPNSLIALVVAVRQHGGMGNTGAMRAIKPPKSIDVVVMRIVTRFATVDEFVSAFRVFCAEGTCFIPSAEAKRIGIETGFSIRLADGTPMLRGLCVVLDSWTTAENPYERPGVRLGIRSLTAESKPIFQRLLLAAGLDEHNKATVEMAPLFPTDERLPGSEFILPANPLMEMSDDWLNAFVDCSVFEDAIPEAIGDANATSRIDDDRNEPTTRRIEVLERTERIESPLDRTAGRTTQLDGGTQRIVPLPRPPTEDPIGPFGHVLANAAQRIQPVADHTQPTQIAETTDATEESSEPIDLEQLVAIARDSARRVGPTPAARPTILGIAPIASTGSRPRISMQAITDTQPAPATTSTELVRLPPAPGLWWRLKTTVRGWYTRLVWARRRRAGMRRSTT
jgi:hypothetical protein